MDGRNLVNGGEFKTKGMIDFQSLRQVVDARPNGQEKYTDLTIGGVSTDTRTIHRGDCFFAIVGPNYDGHHFILHALEKGAVCAVAQNQVALPSEWQGRVIWVRDTVLALGQLAAWYRKQLAAKVVAITGSAGKTTTRHIIHHVLNRRLNCHQAANSFNNHIGLPLTILSAQPQHQVLLLEVGTNHPGEIAALSQIAAPDMALVTCVAPAHLEGFGTVENIIREKLSICRSLTQGGLFIINGDQSEVVEYAKTLNCPFITFGISPGCDVRTDRLQSGGWEGQLTIEKETFVIPLPGRANLMNALAAWTVCRTFGVTVPEFAEAMSSLQPVAMRMNIETTGPIKIINDCYNANPASMTNALECLTELSRKERRRSVFVSGCMAELGPTSAKLHQELGQKAAQAGVDEIIAAGQFASDIIAGAVKSGLDASACKAFGDTQTLCDNLHSFVHPDDIILVKGSRMAGMEKAVERLRSLFQVVNGRQATLCENKK
jgi:UDP-N-acetylmuramoyl-tripeptide--D-alanyl-D-alanine ligase